MRWFVVLAALGGPALPLLAQAPPIVNVGTKVRLRIPAGDGTFLPRFDGTIVRIAGDTLTLRPRRGGGARLYTPSSESQLLVLSEKRPAMMKGATIGALTGVLAAGFFAALGKRSCNGSGALCFIRRHTAVRNTAVLGSVGLVTGAAIGLLSPKKIWTRVWMPVPQGGLAEDTGHFHFGFSLAF